METILDPAGVTAVATGTAGWARLADSTGAAIADFDVTATGGGGSLTLATAALTTGVTVDFGAITLTLVADADLTGWALRFIMAPRVGGPSVSKIVNGTVTSGQTTITVPLTTADTATAGVFVCEVEATRAGAVATYPCPGYVRLVVQEDLG